VKHPEDEQGARLLPNYTHVARKGVAGVTSPLDLLDGVGAADVQAAAAATARLQGHVGAGALA
jgi:hypothetical protein